MTQQNSNVVSDEEIISIVNRIWNKWVLRYEGHESLTKDLFMLALQDEEFNLLHRQQNTIEPIKGEELIVEDLQKQVRDHIKNHDLFDWDEVLTKYEMVILENLLLTFCPLFPKGSIGYNMQSKQYAANNSGVLNICHNKDCKYCSGTGEVPVISETTRKISYNYCFGNGNMASMPHREESMDANNSVEGEAIDKWIDINDRLPENNDNVLIFANKIGEQIEVAFYNNEDKEWNGLNDFWLQHITHWQPLPNPPKK